MIHHQQEAEVAEDDIGIDPVQSAEETLKNMTEAELKKNLAENKEASKYR